MENTLIFASEKEVQFGKLLKFIIPTYLTSLFNTVYTIIDGIFVSAYVGTNALAAINIVYPIVNVLTGIALVFATGGSAVAALHIGGNRKEEASHAFSVSSVAAVLLSCLVSLIVLTNLSTILSLLGATDVTIAGCKTYALWWLWATPVVIGKELFTYFIRVDGSPAYSFVTALSGGVLNIVLDYVLVGRMHMGIYGAALATILGLVLSFLMGIYYFARKYKALSFTLHGLSAGLALRCMVNGASEFVDQLAIAITTIVFNRTALAFAGEDGVAAVSIIMYLQFLFIGVYFGFSMGMAPPLSYAYGDRKIDVCRKLEQYAHRFFAIAPLVIYAAIREGFANLRPDSDYDALYQSALCRAKADWLVGINATRLFSVLYHKTLTVGRVQTPTLKMLVDRDAKILRFQKEKYYTCLLYTSPSPRDGATSRMPSSA